MVGKAHGAKVILHIGENRLPSRLERTRVEIDLCASTTLAASYDTACLRRVGRGGVLGGGRKPRCAGRVIREGRQIR